MSGDDSRLTRQQIRRELAEASERAEQERDDVAQATERSQQAVNEQLDNK